MAVPAVKKSNCVRVEFSNVRFHSASMDKSLIVIEARYTE